MKSLRQSESGFTIIEMVIVVTLVGVLASFALSSFTSLRQSQQAKSASFELYTSLSMARSEAIKRNNNVTLTPLVAGDWGKGWTVTTITPVTLAVETLRSQAAMKGVTITPGGAGSVVFSRTGRVATSVSFQVDSSPVNVNVRRCVNIDLSGMPRANMGACT